MEVVPQKITQFVLAIIIVAGMALVGLCSAQAQQDETTLKLFISRTFGYSSGTGKIQGAFTLRAEGPPDLERVVYYLDGNPIGESTEPPFKFKFSTSDYPLGEHTIQAKGYTSGGQSLQSEPITRTFVSASEGWRSGISFALGIIGAVLVIAMIAIAFSFLVGRGRRSKLPLGAPRHYGWKGGAICPNCQRPFSLHWYGLNLFSKTFDHCSNCGKWGMVTIATPEQLQKAEMAELGGSQPIISSEESSEERLRREIDNSRYMDM